MKQEKLLEYLEEWKVSTNRDLEKMKKETIEKEKLEARLNGYKEAVIDMIGLIKQEI